MKVQWQVNANTGKPCESFGTNGFVDLKLGMGEIEPGQYYPTSAPTVADGRIIVGGWVTDNRSIDEPGGVVRAFSAIDGKLVWAWDPGRGAPSGASEKEFVRSTPNMWGTATFDSKLGLVFVPTGNGTPDHWGPQRSPETDRFSTAVVALHVATGELAWVYQTVHHDLWDWDLSGPPTFEVVEKPVPQTAMPGERLSPTQPYSVGMPTVIPTTFSEETMWGATFFDQLACRIAYRKLNYLGQYTPPSTQETPITPGYLGGFNWGGMAIDKDRNVLVVNDIRLATIMRLVSREEADRNGSVDFTHSDVEMHKQSGTPYGVELKSFMSPIGFPCEQPNWGMITGIDLVTRKIIWQIPAGTASATIRDMTGASVPVAIGMPTLSAATATSAGLTFYTGFNDEYVRAYETTTGKELWKSKLPVGSQATPMSYVSKLNGKQYLLVAAGGAARSKHIGDYVIAYALPDRSTN